MDNVKILEVKQSIFASNDEQAAALRAELKQEKIFLLNLMSAPGSGKTTTLRRTIAALQNELRIGVMEADIDSDVDARAIAETGAKAIQLHTGGMCHLDAEMTRQGLAGLGTGGSRFGDSGKCRQPCLPCRVRHRRGEERHDSVGSRGSRQAAEIPADVPGLRRRARQQNRRAAVF